VGDGHHLHPDGARLRLSGGCARLIQPPRAVVAAVDHDGGGVLGRGAGGRSRTPRQAGYLQHGSGQPVHRRDLHGHTDQNKIAISMDGKGAWRDNVCVERLLRSVKYEEVYLRAYDSVSDARASIGRYLSFYNQQRYTRALTARHQIKPTSRRCPSAWQPNPGRRSIYRRGKNVQTTETHLTVPSKRRR
jgi:integrase-like protein